MINYASEIPKDKKTRQAKIKVQKCRAETTYFEILLWIFNPKTIPINETIIIEPATIKSNGRIGWKKPFTKKSKP